MTMPATTTLAQRLTAVATYVDAYVTDSRRNTDAVRYLIPTVTMVTRP